MTNKRKAIWVFSFICNAIIIYNAYFETGPFTTALLSLMYITFLLQSVLNTAQGEVNNQLAEFAAKVAGTKL